MKDSFIMNQIISCSSIGLCGKMSLTLLMCFRQKVVLENEQQDHGDADIPVFPILVLDFARLDELHM